MSAASAQRLVESRGTRLKTELFERVSDAGVGLWFGFAVSYVFFLVAAYVFLVPVKFAFVVGAVAAFVCGFGMAFSVGVRCWVILLLPSFTSSQSATPFHSSC